MALQLQEQKQKFLACGQCLFPLDAKALTITACACGELFCCETCYHVAKQRGHELLCPALLGAEQVAALESLSCLLEELANVGESFRLAIKWVARALKEGLHLLELSAGLAGVPWWETAGLRDTFIPEARDITRSVFSILQAVLPGLPVAFTADDLALLVGQLRMPLVLLQAWCIFPSSANNVRARALRNAVEVFVTAAEDHGLHMADVFVCGVL